MTVPDATPEVEALEPLIRAAMAAGAMCAAERARDGLIDPLAPLGDAFGDFPAEFLSIRRFTVADALAHIRAEALREYADALAHNESAAYWPAVDDFVGDVRDWADTIEREAQP